MLRPAALLPIISCILLNLFLWAGPVFSASLVLSEIMFNPAGDENAREFVEIQNISGGPVSMEGCRIGDGAGFNDLAAVRENVWTIPAGGFAVILDPDYFTANEPYLTLSGNAVLLTVTSKALGSRGLSNSTPEPVYLVSAKGDTLSLVRYSLDCPEGHSWERINPRGDDSPENFLPSRKAEGTPGYRNSVTPSDRNPVLAPGSLRFGPDPRMGEGLDIQVSYRNGGLAPLEDAMVSVRMLPDTSLGTLEFRGALAPGEDAPPQILHVSNVPGGLLTFQAVIEGGDPLSASDDTLRADLDVVIPHGIISLNEVMAAPKDGPEWVELLNTGKAPVSIRGWRITDSRGVPSDSLDAASLLPSGGFVLIAGDSVAIGGHSGALVIPARKFPSLNNDGDRVVLLDRAGALRDSMSYSSAPEGISLERISPRLSGKGAWDKCTDPSGATPGARNSLFFIHVEEDSPSLSGSTLTITPNPFSETTVIAYDLPFPLARVRLEVYDRRGRKVAVIRDAAESGSVWRGEWNGGKLPAGPYILTFEALNKNTGKMVTMRKTVVVGKKL